MGWVRLSDDFYDHPKFAEAGPLAIALWATGLAWCNRNLSDGFIPRARARTLLDFDGLAIVNGMHGEDAGPDMVINQLVDVGLWDEEDGGYRYHDYHDYQPSAEAVDKRRLDQHTAKVLAGKARSAGASRTSAGTFQKRRSEPADQQNGQHDHQQPTSPNPNPNLKSSSISTVTHDPPVTPADDDDQKLVEQALELLADRRMAGITPLKPAGYRRTVLANLRHEHAPALAKIPDDITTPQQLADWLEPAPVTPNAYAHYPDWTSR